MTSIFAGKCSLRRGNARLQVHRITGEKSKISKSSAIIITDTNIDKQRIYVQFYLGPRVCLSYFSLHLRDHIHSTYSLIRTIYVTRTKSVPEVFIYDVWCHWKWGLREGSSSLCYNSTYSIVIVPINKLTRSIKRKYTTPESRSSINSILLLVLFVSGSTMVENHFRQPPLAPSANTSQTIHRIRHDAVVPREPLPRQYRIYANTISETHTEIDITDGDILKCHMHPFTIRPPSSAKMWATIWNFFHVRCYDILRWGVSKF